MNRRTDIEAQRPAAVRTPAGGAAAPRTGRQETRYVYGGERRSLPGIAAARGNRPVVRRRVSPFNIVLVLFAVGIGIVFVVDNIVAVNELAYAVGQLEERVQRVENENRRLVSQRDTKQALDKISPAAAERLGMRPWTGPAPEISVDRETLARVRGE